MRKLTLLIAILIATLAVPVARADDAPDSIDQFNARLDRARATLDDVQKILEQPELSDAALRNLRARIEPLPHELDETIDKLTPRLAAIEARLKELAPAATKPHEAPKEAPKASEKPPEPKPAPKPSVKNRVENPPPARGPPVAAPEAAPSEPEQPDASARVSADAELEDQRRLFDAIDATLKRARAIQLEARQVIVTIVARQRGLFAKNLFLRTAGLFSPELWRAALEDAPSVASASASFLSGRASNLADRVNSGRRAQFFAALILIVAGVAVAIFMARRVMKRVDRNATPTPLRRAAGAGWSAFVVAVVPVAAIGALSLALDAFDLLDAALEPIWLRLV
ncbi:MAG: DUF3772 domain-containing protein, partial [Alphaproteobacteria bacterium]|nr:DUF3772 domain-containing protein [Alphaproteobacteria bacterium]